MPSRSHLRNILIVDDERTARVEMERMIRILEPDCDIQTADSVEESLCRIKEKSPDAIFLDIQMPGGDGFDLLYRLGKQRPPVVFTTAHEQFAARAFEHDAVDYLLKPFGNDRLKTALTRLGISGPAENTFTADDLMILKVDGECILVRVGDIDLLESKDGTTMIYTDARLGKVNKTLAQLEEQLDPKLFFRTSRDQLLNLQRVRNISITYKDSLQATLFNGSTVRFSRRRGVLFQKSHSF